MTTVDEVRGVVRAMREDTADWDPAEPKARVFLGFIRLLEFAADEAAGVEAMNERTRQRADRVGGDGHTWVMHRPAWSAALEIAAAWAEAARP